MPVESCYSKTVKLLKRLLSLITKPLPLDFASRVVAGSGPLLLFRTRGRVVVAQGLVTEFGRHSWPVPPCLLVNELLFPIHRLLSLMFRQVIWWWHFLFLFFFILCC